MKPSNFSITDTLWWRSTDHRWLLTTGRNAEHYTDVVMGTIASQITSLTIVYSAFYSGADQRKHQSCTSLAFVRGIHRGPVNSPHKWPVTRNMFPFDDVIMKCPFMTSCIYQIHNSSRGSVQHPKTISTSSSPELTHRGLVTPYSVEYLSQQWRHQTITWTNVCLP